MKIPYKLKHLVFLRPSPIPSGHVYKDKAAIAFAKINLSLWQKITKVGGEQHGIQDCINENFNVTSSSFKFYYPT